MGGPASHPNRRMTMERAQACPPTGQRHVRIATGPPQLPGARYTHGVLPIGKDATRHDPAG